MVGVRNRRTLTNARRRYPERVKAAQANFLGHGLPRLFLTTEDTENGFEPFFVTG
jgi:hypothetical protein